MSKITLVSGALTGSLLLLVVAYLLWGMLAYHGPQKPTVASAMLLALDDSIEAFHRDTGTYPVKLTELFDGDGEGWNGPYVRHAGTLFDPWGNPFVYAASATSEFYVLLSFGADGKPGGEGVYRDIISQNSGTRR